MPRRNKTVFGPANYSLDQLLDDSFEKHVPPEKTAQFLAKVHRIALPPNPIYAGVVRMRHALGALSLAFPVVWIELLGHKIVPNITIIVVLIGGIVFVVTASFSNRWDEYLEWQDHVFSAYLAAHPVPVEVTTGAIRLRAFRRGIVRVSCQGPCRLLSLEDGTDRVYVFFWYEPRKRPVERRANPG